VHVEAGPLPRQRMAAGAAPPADTPAQLVTDALAVAERDPATAVRLASAVLARRGAEPALRVRARLALGRAAWARRDVATAVRQLRRAAADADGLALHADAAQARLTLAAALADSGRGAAAVRVLGAAAPHLDGVDAARGAGQRAYLLHLQGRLPEALEGYLEVLELFRRLDDPLRQAVTLLNIAVVHTHQGLLGRAASELTAAHRLFEQAGEPLRAAHAAANLGWVLARQGRVPEALRWFEHAEQSETGDDAGGTRRDPQTGKDRAEALLGARLLPEAREAAGLAEREFEHLGMRGPVAECRLLGARASLLLGEHGAAREQAEAAEQAAGAGRPAVRALAQHLRLQAVLAGSAPDPQVLAAARRVAGRLEAAGWLVHAAEARLTAAQVALALGRPAVARAELAATRARVGGGPVQLRLAAWHARALLRLAEGDGPGARAALRAGVRVLDRHRAALGATELRALATGHGLPLLRLGAGLALEAGDAWDALAWTERGRSAAGPVASRPAGDGALAVQLDALRQCAAEAETALMSGGDPRRAFARQVALERAVRRRSLTADATPGGDVGASRLRTVLPAALGDAVLVEMFEHEGSLHAVVVRASESRSGRRGGARLDHLGPAAAVTAELAALQFAAARLARASGSPRAQAAAARGWAESARRLSQALMTPVEDLPGTGGLVLAPSGTLHALPWAALPGLTGRPVAVTPSAALWLRTARAADRALEGPDDEGDAAIVLVAGPGLPGADAEVGALAAALPGARHLHGDHATVGAVLPALAGARVAHIAAHGLFRADNPQLSSLRLADGPLTGYDLEGLASPPRTVVLSACDAGLTGVRSGEEVQGLVAVLLALGTGAVIAAVAPVADDLTAAFALDLHARLAAGTPPPSALAAVQQDWSRRGVREAVTATSFVCFGGGRPAGGSAGG
jgi:tetratricopeptide (TPR) repeat protein